MNIIRIHVRTEKIYIFQTQSTDYKNSVYKINIDVAVLYCCTLLFLTLLYFWYSL